MTADPLGWPADFDTTHAEVLRVARKAALDSAVHGPAHWRAVAAIGGELARVDRRVDYPILVLFALMHDSKRLDDGRDPEHGRRAAALAVGIADLLRLEPDRLARLAVALELHSDGMRHADPTVGAAWDADRLCLCRLGIAPDPRRLSTATAAGLARGSAAELAGVVATLHATPPTWARLASDAGAPGVAVPAAEEAGEGRVRAYKMRLLTGELPFTPGSWPPPGVWTETRPRTKDVGWHASTLGDLRGWLGPQVWACELEGWVHLPPVGEEAGELVARRARLLAPHDRWCAGRGRLFAAGCLARALPEDAPPALARVLDLLRASPPDAGVPAETSPARLAALEAALAGLAGVARAWAAGSPSRVLAVRCALDGLDPCPFTGPSRLAFKAERAARAAAHGLAARDGASPDEAREVGGVAAAAERDRQARHLEELLGPPGA